MAEARPLKNFIRSFIASDISSISLVFQSVSPAFVTFPEFSTKDLVNFSNISRNFLAAAAILSIGKILRKPVLTDLRNVLIIASIFSIICLKLSLPDFHFPSTLLSLPLTIFLNNSFLILALLSIKSLITLLILV